MKNITIGYLLSKTRLEAKKSQEYVALKLSVARKTIQNWENDVSSPDIDQVIEYFRVLGVSPIPSLFEYVFPDMDTDDDEKLRNEFIEIVKTMPMEAVRQLMNIYCGEHGSSPRAVMNMVSAHLETPMKDRISNASLISKNYELAFKKNRQLGNVLVDKEFLDKAIESAESSFVENKKAYILHDKK